MSTDRGLGRWELPVLRLWHAALAGGFLVAWITADEDTYRMHVFAGYWVLTVVALRLALAAVGSKRGPLALVRPNRSTLMIWMGGMVMALVGMSAVSGVIADGLSSAEDLHEGLSNAVLWLIAGHVAVVAWVFQGKRLREALFGAVKRSAIPALLLVGGLVLGTGSAVAGDPARESILAGYAKAAKSADPAFSGFSAQRGEQIYRSRNTASADFVGCFTCHTDDPTRPGRHAKTGREIAPAAVSANPKRFTDAEKVEERFGRDCKTVLGRDCSARDKGDFITFLASK
jgi:cytochrome b